MIRPDRHTCLGTLLRDALIQFKTDTALVEMSRKREAGRWTFRQFAAEAMPVARRLQDVGVGAGDRVAILMSNQSKWLFSAWAVFYRGAVLVPLDFKLSPGEQRALLAHCRPAVLVVEHGLWRRLGDVDVPHVWVSEAPDDADLGRARRWEDRPTGDAELVPRDREDPATIVYSSGTGGRPKGCVLPHRAYLAQIDALMGLYPYERGDVFFSILPTNHAIDLMCGFLGPLICGATVVHQRSLRPELLVWTMREHRVTHMAVVPLVLEAFERALNERLAARPAWQQRALDGLAAVNQRLTDARPRHAVSSRLLKPVHDAFGGRLKVLYCGGAFVDRRRAEAFYRLGLPVVIGYGLTEACTVVSVGDLRPFRADSVGRPVPGTEVRIASPGPDGIGEVQVRGPTVMTGYLDDPELTAEAFDGEWLRTGDLGHLDAAWHLHLVGRARDMIVTPGGKNIYPEDVEALLAEVPCEELAVFAADFLWPRRDLAGESLVAVLRPTDDTSWPAAVAALDRHNRRLPEHKRLTGVVAWDEPFPRTASLKLKRAALAEVLRDRHDRDAIQSLRSACAT